MSWVAEVQSSGIVLYNPVSIGNAVYLSFLADVIE